MAEVECVKDNKLNSNPQIFLTSPNANAGNREKLLRLSFVGRERDGGGENRTK